MYYSYWIIYIGNSQAVFIVKRMDSFSPYKVRVYNKPILNQLRYNE